MYTDLKLYGCFALLSVENLLGEGETKLSSSRSTMAAQLNESQVRVFLYCFS